uniref:Uncharacterized protein n=1 Tax=Anguilla anguilla TaxID=7936 RepID=A0A0E9X142_ANGAN
MTVLKYIFRMRLSSIQSRARSRLEQLERLPQETAEERAVTDMCQCQRSCIKLQKRCLITHFTYLSVPSGFYHQRCIYVPFLSTQSNTNRKKKFYMKAFSCVRKHVCPGFCEMCRLQITSIKLFRFNCQN